MPSHASGSRISGSSRLPKDKNGSKKAWVGWKRSSEGVRAGLTVCSYRRRPCLNRAHAENGDRPGKLTDRPSVGLSRHGCRLSDVGVPRERDHGAIEPVCGKDARFCSPFATHSTPLPSSSLVPSFLCHTSTAWVAAVTDEAERQYNRTLPPLHPRPPRSFLLASRRDQTSRSKTARF